LRGEDVWLWVGLLASAVVILCYALLIPAAGWLGDEFFQAADLAQSREALGPYLLKRLLWSPRPLSEAVLMLYYRATLYVHGALVTVVTAALWGFYCLVTLVWARNTRGSVFRARLLLPMFLLAVLMTAGEPRELFFWPAGSAPYLLTVAFVVAFVLRALGQGDGAGLPVGRAGLLVGAALSSEVGTFFVMAVCGTRLAVWAAVDRRRSGGSRDLAGWGVPLLVSGLVVWVSVTHRVVLETHAGPTVHHGFRSAVWAVRVWGRDLLFGMPFPGVVTPLRGVWWLLAIVLSLMGVGGLLAVALPVPGRRCDAMALGVALLLASYGIVFASGYQYGFRTERHMDMQLLFHVLAGGCFIRALWPVWGVWGRLMGLVAVPGCVVLLMGSMIPAYRESVARVEAIRVDRARTWASGFSPGEAMTYFMRTDPPLVFGTPPGVNPGLLGPPGEPEWARHGVLTLFHKKELHVVHAP